MLAFLFLFTRAELRPLHWSLGQPILTLPFVTKTQKLMPEECKSLNSVHKCLLKTMKAVYSTLRWCLPPLNSLLYTKKRILISKSHLGTTTLNKWPWILSTATDIPTLGNVSTQQLTKDGEQFQNFQSLHISKIANIWNFSKPFCCTLPNVT